MLTDLEFVSLILDEDCWKNDVTSRSLKNYFLSSQKDPPGACEFVIFSKDHGIFSGKEFIHAFAKVANFEARYMLKEGEEFGPGDFLLVGIADPLRILSFERSLLNGLQLLCATATKTHELVTRIKEACLIKGVTKAPGLFHTRKTLPLMRAFQLRAVEAGGGELHRRNLQDRVLLKENHKYLALTSGLGFEGLIEEALKIDPLAIVEVENPQEAFKVCSLGVRHLMLDNFTPAQVQETLKLLKGRVEIEISGGITTENLSSFLFDGVSRLSTSVMTMRAGALDLSLDWKNT